MDAWRRRKRYVQVGAGRRLAVVDSGGEGPAVLLLHGYTDSSRSYQALAGEMDGFRLLMPDLPGHGDSDEDPKADLSTLVADLSQLVRALGVVPALVVGHSFGSLLALELARQRIWLDLRVVLLAGTACPAAGGLEALEPIRAFLAHVDPRDPFLDHWYAGPVALDGAFLDAVRREAAAMPVRVWHRYLDLLERTDLREALPGIATPVLSISGGRDTLFDARHADLLGQGLPHLRDVRLADRGHNPHWEAPGEVSDLVAHWLAEGHGG